MRIHWRKTGSDRYEATVKKHRVLIEWEGTCWDIRIAGPTGNAILGESSLKSALLTAKEYLRWCLKRRLCGDCFFNNVGSTACLQYPSSKLACENFKQWDGKK